MFFNAKQYLSYLEKNPHQQEIAFQLAGFKPSIRDPHSYKLIPPARRPEMSEEIAEKALETVKKALINRQHQAGTQYVSKWLRPWHVVPELQNFAAPEGDYGIGVEVELGFNSVEIARKVAAHIADWEYITLDWEGPANPIEVTFPPVLYSTLDTMDAIRYMDYLASLPEGEIYRHAANSSTGTHINVSLPKRATIDNMSLQTVNTVLEGLEQKYKDKYFGRRPYGYGNTYENYNVVEWKLFNSQTSSDRLKQYINVAVELTALCEQKADAPRITRELVLEALERGYNKPRTAAVVEEPAVRSNPLRRAAA